MKDVGPCLTNAGTTEPHASAAEHRCGETTPCETCRCDGYAKTWAQQRAMHSEVPSCASGSEASGRMPDAWQLRLRCADNNLPGRCTDTNAVHAGLECGRTEAPHGTNDRMVAFFIEAHWSPTSRQRVQRKAYKSQTAKNREFEQGMTAVVQSNTAAKVMASKNS